MATEKVPSKPEWVAYAERQLQEQFRQDWLHNADVMGYPNKEEAPEIVAKTNLSCPHTLSAIGGTITGYMQNSKRGFELPSPDEKTTSATLKIVAVDEKTTTGVQTFGPDKGKEYSSTTAAHEEFKVSNNRKPFKK